MRTHFLLVLLSVLVVACVNATPVLAIGIPSPERSIVPGHIVLVGLSGGVADAALAEFVVKVRDHNSNPWPGASVSVDFSSAWDVRLAAVQPDAELIVDCNALSVRKTADAQGEARFTIVGCGAGVFSSGNTQSRIRVYANGAELAAPAVHTYDLDGQLGLGAGDLSLFLQEFSTGTGSWAADYDGSGSIGSADLSLWLAAFSKATQTSSAGVVCP